MAAIASLNIDLKAGTAKLVKGFRTAGAVVGRFGATVRRVSGRLIRFGAATAAVAAGALTFLVKQQFAAIDSIAKLSTSLNIATEKLIAYQFAAEIGGVKNEQFNKGLKRMVKGVSDAQNGLSTAKRAFDKFGLSSQDLAQMSTGEIFKEIAEQVKNTGQTIETTGALMDIFGSRVGSDFFNILSQGRSGLEAFERESEKLGISLSAIDAAKIEAANDAVARLKLLFIGAARQIAVNLAPMITFAADRLREFGLEGEGVGARVRAAMDGILQVMARIADVAQLMVGIFQVLQSAVLKVQQVFVSGISNLLQLVEKAANALSIDLGEGFKNGLQFAEFFAEELGRSASEKFTAGFKNIDVASGGLGESAGKKFLRGVDGAMRKFSVVPKLKEPEVAPPTPSSSLGGSRRQGNAALGRGSAAAFSAVAQVGQRNMLSELKLLATQGRDQVRELREINRNTRGEGGGGLAVAPL